MRCDLRKAYLAKCDSTTHTPQVLYERNCAFFERARKAPPRKIVSMTWENILMSLTSRNGGWRAACENSSKVASAVLSGSSQRMRRECFSRLTRQELKARFTLAFSGPLWHDFLGGISIGASTRQSYVREFRAMRIVRL